MLEDLCAAIEMLVLDVDGVLTAGGIIYGDDGRELKVFHVRDGTGLKAWHLVGKKSAIITGRSSPVVDIRARDLGIHQVVQRADNKLTAYRQVLAVAGVDPAHVCFVGDDLADLPLLRHCGLPVAVADACPEAQEAARYVTRARGGFGAVRETIELILRSQGSWQQIIQRYREEKL
jgi:YrbI family 3-deoxy-D-manno-octulosonate 8-phosphate phosphatase